MNRPFNLINHQSSWTLMEQESRLKAACLNRSRQLILDQAAGRLYSDISENNQRVKDCFSCVSLPQLFLVIGRRELAELK